MFDTDVQLFVRDFRKSFVLSISVDNCEDIWMVKFSISLHHPASSDHVVIQRTVSFCICGYVDVNHKMDMFISWKNRYDSQRKIKDTIILKYLSLKLILNRTMTNSARKEYFSNLNYVWVTSNNVPIYAE